MSSTFTNEVSKRTALCLFGLLVLVGFGYLGCMPAGYTVTAGAEVDSYVSSDVSDYDYLSDYGEWMHIPPFGMVWHPYVVADWAPFCHGHWSWTYDGWAWISYEPFGWLVYHYGYWDYTPAVGWFWVPGNTWSPAQVEWYTFGDYCGWAPLPPPGVYWPDPWQPYTVNVWVVVDINDFTEYDVIRRRIGKPFPRDLIQRHPVAKQPPAIRRLEEVTRRKIDPVKIQRQPSDVRSDVVKVPPRAGRPRDVKLRSMILPELDNDKVKQYAPQVERDVLVPKKEAPPERREPIEQPKVQPQPEKKREPQKDEQQPEKKQKEDRRKKRS